MTTIPLKAVTLTDVRYTKGDQIGHLLAWISLIPVFITFGGFFAHFFFRRELQGICFALGLAVSQLINEFIKTTVSQSRPATCAALEACDSHGWPSSHSQYMFFFATYFSLLSYRKAGFFGGRENSWLVEALTWALAVLTMFSRVYLGYHSVVQVFAGAILGTVLGAAWYWFGNRVLVKFFPLIEDSYVGRTFYIKDTSHIPDVLKFEYDNARAARKNAVDKSS
ncbi:hypothetical protein KSS87_002996 [Heliosperma pusillum]|nr:hypothetical protein KSS87_002996 [Heliosperma pusillum]